MGAFYGCHDRLSPPSPPHLLVFDAAFTTIQRHASCLVTGLEVFAQSSEITVASAKLMATNLVLILGSELVILVISAFCMPPST